MDIFFDYMAHEGKDKKVGRLEAIQRDLCIFHQPTHRGIDKHYLQEVAITFPNPNEIHIRAKRVRYNQTERAPADDILIIFTKAYFEIGPPGVARHMPKATKRYPLADNANPQARFALLQSQIRQWSVLPRPRFGLLDNRRLRFAVPR